MKNYLLALSLLAMLACETKKPEKDTSGKGTLDISVSKEGSEESIRKPLALGAGKFKGEFVEIGDENTKVLIRNYPSNPSFLAGTTTIGNYEPQTVPYWYDDEKNVLSSKVVNTQNVFSVLQLDSSGDKLIKITHTWERNTSDTTTYRRTQ